MILKNFQGIHLIHECAVEFKKMIKYVHHNNLSIIAIPVTNLNWNTNMILERYNNILSTYYTNYNTNYNTIPLIKNTNFTRKIEKHAQGAPIIFLLNNITTQIIGNDQDPFDMGRCSWIVIQSKEIKGIPMITSYITRQ